MIGKTVSHYTISEQLGQGGMGVVYKAQDTTLGRSVALKFLTEQSFQNPEARARFQREAQAASALNHPNICTVYELGEHEGQPFIAMELLEGQPLDHLLQAGAIGVPRLVEYGIQIADALSAAHEKHIVHRDLKPANVFITTRGQVKILDFGLAKTRAEQSPGDPDAPTQEAQLLTTPGTSMGTVSYMSPEQALGKPLDHRTDLFSLGIVLYEMATGGRPFNGHTSVEVWNEIINRQLPSLQEVNPKLPQGLCRCIERCLAKNPDDRYASAGELADDLKHLDRVASTMAGYAPGAVPSSGKNSLLKVALSVLAVLVIAAGGFGVSRLLPERAAAETKTLAVLPFENLSPDPEDAFFAAGVHEDVITKLGGLQNLNVISRSSAERAAKSGEDLAGISRRLGARYLVEGSVRRWEDQVRITAQLIDADTAKNMWSATYDRRLDNTLAVQADIAREIADALSTTMTAEERNRLGASQVVVVEAYDNYLKARVILNASRVPFDKLEEAIGLLEQATGQDPRFLLGWTLLSRAETDLSQRYADLGDRPADADQAAWAAEAALAKAKELDPEAAATHRAEGHFLEVVKDDPIEALRSYDRALAAYPNDADTYYLQAQLYVRMGQLEPSVDALERAYALDSTNGRIVFFLTFAYEFTHRYQDIVPFLERLVELEPDKTHYIVQAKYYQFLADGKLESFHAFEDAVNTVERTEACDVRAVQNHQMVVAMINGRFEAYARAWKGKFDAHQAGHGNWVCPMIVNDDLNQAHLELEYGDPSVADTILEQARKATSRPYSEMTFCIFDKAAYEPKLDFLSGDSERARAEFESTVPKILANDAFPQGPVERAVLLETADLVAPERVYEIYKDITQRSVSFVSLETVCANPWTYPNLLKDPRFLAEVRADGRFVQFLEHYHLIPMSG